MRIWLRRCAGSRIRGSLPGAALPLLQRVVAMGEEVPAAAIAWRDFRRLADGVTPAEFAAACAAVAPDDPLLMQFTSGTTAYPKGVLLTHHNMLRNAYAVGLRMGVTADDRYFATDGLCTHGRAHLSGGFVDGTTIECPKHNGRFDFMQVVHADGIQNRNDVLFYFTGTAKVIGLETIRFLPGAIADHLTSAGGQLTDSGQMSSLRWLEAGATGSYGTVLEPCNLLEKFPSPGIVIMHYLHGDSLIEAYWKSVAMPGTKN